MMNGTLSGSASLADAKALRRRAEEIAEGKSAIKPELMSQDEVYAALHELYVHQIELEMQNEELRRSQAEIECIRAQYFDLYDMAPVGYCTLSDKGIILQANLTAAKHLGVTRNQLIHTPFSRYIYREDQDVYYLHIMKHSGGSDPRPFELKMKRSDATLFWANIDAAIVQNNGQQTYRVTISDITQRKLGEEALRESHARAHELIEELRKADKDKNYFLGVLSHEIRNPLATIVAAISLLDLAKDPDQTKNIKKGMKRQAGQLCRLVDDLLDLTRINEGRIRLKKERVDLNELVNNVAQDIRAQFETKGVRLEMQPAPEPLWLAGDPVRITQAVENLLYNALKFTESGGEVRFTAAVDKGEAILRIRDNGVGISPAMLPTIFKPFSQADDSLARSTGGLGLGLSIAKGIVEQHGGGIAAYSAGMDEGSEFTIRLPLSDGDSPAPEP